MFLSCETAIISSLLPSASPGPSSIDFFDPVTANMGRTVDQEVHAAFVEFRAKEDDKVRFCVFPCNISVHIHIHRTAYNFSSVFPSSASTVSKSAQRIPRVRNNIFSSVPVFAAIPVLLSRSLSQLSPPPMVSPQQMVTLLLPTVRPPPRRALAQVLGVRFPPPTAP